VAEAVVVVVAGGDVGKRPSAERKS
jgi:hypothetical protein